MLLFLLLYRLHLVLHLLPRCLRWAVRLRRLLYHQEEAVHHRLPYHLEELLRPCQAPVRRGVMAYLLTSEVAQGSRKSAIRKRGIVVLQLCQGPNRLPEVRALLRELLEARPPADWLVRLQVRSRIGRRRSAIVVSTLIDFGSAMGC